MVTSGDNIKEAGNKEMQSRQGSTMTLYFLSCLSCAEMAIPTNAEHCFCFQCNTNAEQDQRLNG